MIIAVIGHDKVGILARISGVCAQYNANVVSVSQTILGEYFTMIMLAEIDALTCTFSAFSEYVANEGKSIGMVTHIMHEGIFDAMHRI